MRSLTFLMALFTLLACGAIELPTIPTDDDAGNRAADTNDTDGDTDDGDTDGDTPPASTLLTPSQVVGNANYLAGPITNTLDGDRTTFMTTETLTLGQVVTIAYQFSSPVDIAYVEFFDDYTDTWAMGDLVIESSSDSTDGTNGTWATVTTMTASTTDFILGDGTVQMNLTAKTWVRLSMTYNGSGAIGSTPSFYLSEIKFYRP